MITNERQLVTRKIKKKAQVELAQLEFAPGYTPN